MDKGSCKMYIVDNNKDSQISEWISHLNVDAPQSSNQPSINIPYQRWFRFKEAYSPKLVIDIIDSLPVMPQKVLDPFGGCGTTAITCQFLGITPTAIEVNPFLADLTEAKLTRYDINLLMNEKSIYKKIVDEMQVNMDDIAHFPPTFCEPGIKERWLYGRELFTRIIQYTKYIQEIKHLEIRRLFNVILGSSLIAPSNVYISGKGRKYKKNWKDRQSTPDSFDALFESNLEKIYDDIINFNQKHSDFKLLRGDCRERIKDIDTFDLSIFSPPYPNTFDYTDVYNIELWILGYIKSNDSCKQLRNKTLRSHVQVKRSYSNNHAQSETLDRIKLELESHKEHLWNKEIPDMVGAYFCDLASLLKEMKSKIKKNGDVIIVVGDSAYKSVRIPVADILEEISISCGYTVANKTVLRKLRVSAQQGGLDKLDETLLWIKST